MKKHFAMFALAMMVSMTAFAVDLREYFPASNTIKLNRPNGNEHARYTFTASPQVFEGLYNAYYDLGTDGYHYSWRKEYKINGSWCTKTYGLLFMGDDKSITEVGDWMDRGSCHPDVLFGYKSALNGGSNTGLLWSPAGGLTSDPTTIEVFTAAQNAPNMAYSTNGWQAFSRVGLISELETYTPEFGRDSNGVWGEGNANTYTDVVHIVMYHGTKGPNTTPVRCEAPIAANGAYYQSYKDYNSYAIELWMAKGIGVIKEITTFIEDGSYWGKTNCNGEVFSPKYTYTTFIDD